jgi:hypothetical protein
LNELANEITALIDKLEASSSMDPAMQITAGHLNAILAAMADPDDAGSIASRFADLEQYWLSSVAWCSELSKDIEKIIIDYQELL